MESKAAPALLDSNLVLLQDSSLSLFQKVLLTTDGSVTELLSLYVGEPIKAKKIEQSIRIGIAPATLACSPDTRLLHRKIMLVGSTKGYVFAESVFIFERFSKSIQSKLLETDTPIGLLWRQEKVEMYREIIDTSFKQCETISAHFGLLPDTQLVSRTYLLYQNAKPFGVISETFPLDSFK